MRLLFLGDSITNGSGATRTSNGYASLVAAELGGVAGTQAGGGWTVKDGEPVARATALMFNPDLAFVCFGANDQKTKRGKPYVSVAEYERLLERTCWHVECAAIGSKAIIITPPKLPPYLADAYVEACYRTGRTVIDTYQGYDSEWLSEDGWHPDDTGHRFIADTVLAQVGVYV